MVKNYLSGLFFKTISVYRCLRKIHALVFVIILIFFSGCEEKSASKDPAVLLKSPNEYVQAKGALLLLHNKNEPDDYFIPLLIDILKTSESSVAKCSALLAIARYGAKAEAAIPVVIHLLDDRDNAVVSNAIEVLGEIKSLPNVSLPALLKIVERNKKLSWLACRAIGGFGNKAQDAVPALVNYVNDPDFITRREARSALGQITGNIFWNSVPVTVIIQPEKSSTLKQ